MIGGGTTHDNTGIRGNEGVYENSPQGNIKQDSQRKGLNGSGQLNSCKDTSQKDVN